MARQELDTTEWLISITFLKDNSNTRGSRDDKGGVPQDSRIHAFLPSCHCCMLCCDIYRLFKFKQPLHLNREKVTSRLLIQPTQQDAHYRYSIIIVADVNFLLIPYGKKDILNTTTRAHVRHVLHSPRFPFSAGFLGVEGR